MHPQKTQRVPRNLEQHRRTALPGKQPRHPNHLTPGQVEKNNHQTRPKQLTKGTRRRTQRNKGSATPEAHKKKAQIKGKHPHRKPRGIPKGEQTDPKPRGDQDTEDPNGTDPQSKPTRGGAQSNTPGKVRQQGSQPQPARKDREPVTLGSERDGGQNSRNLKKNQEI